MEITPRELRDVEIRESLRGYHRDEVNDLLERAAGTIEAANERAKQLTDRLTAVQNDAGRTRETEDVLHRTLLLAQRAADEAVAEATAKSRQMLDDADLQSRRLVAEAEADARRKGESERRRLEEEIVDLAGRRDALLADVEAMTRFESEYRERMVRALEADLHALRSRPTTAPSARPEPSDVDVPALDANSAGSAGTNDTPSAPLVVTPPAPASGAPVASAPAVDVVAPVAPVAPDAPVAAVVADAPAADANANANMSTHEVDVRTLFEQSQASNVTNDVAPAPAPAAAEAPAAPPIDLLRSEAVEADVLDDDAFFATLRDAVHDEAPLGPRDDDPTGDNSFFDQDADRGSFRDVFRRRR